MDAVLIDLDDYVKFGEGASGEGYFHRTDDCIMLKLYDPSVDVGLVREELDKASIAHRLGIPSPVPGDFVTDGRGRYGIRYERIRDKMSFSRAIGEHPERVGEYAARFAVISRRLHSVSVSGYPVQNIKDKYLKMLDDSTFFTEEEKLRTALFIKNAPDADTALHGDLQYSNVIESPSGDYFIDFTDFACGHPYFDLGQVLLCSCLTYEDFIRSTYHLEPETAREFWRLFVKEYFGQDTDVEAVTRELRPYAGCMTLIIERIVGERMDRFHELLP